MFNFSRIGDRMLALVGAVVIIGMAAIVLVFAERQERSILEQNELTLLKVTESAVAGLSAIMLRGYAEDAFKYADRLKEVQGIDDYRILRLDGLEAFRDNATVHAVNAFLGEEEFETHPDDSTAPRVVDSADARLRQVVETGEQVIFYETGKDGTRSVTILEPVPGRSECLKCHADGESIRGVIKLTTSLATIDEDIARTWMISVLVILGGLASISAIVYAGVRRILAVPIRKVTAAMEVAALGDLTATVPITGRDEIGRMAESFNRMSSEVQRLYAGLLDQKSKLTTIIQGAREGIVVTDAAGRVALVNPAGEQLLGKAAEDVAAQGFLSIFDDTEWMTDRLERSLTDSTPSVIEYKGNTLAVQASTIRDESGQAIGSAALIRDITDEKRLEKELKRRAETDGLTGLFNRRYFDAALESEWSRHKRYQSGMSILMFDVDHFKRFNDTHGHECGDRVLQELARLLNEIEDPTAIACRYGGEEMVMICVDTDQEKALILAEVIRKRVEAFVIDGLRVTVSIGVAGSPPQRPVSAVALLKLADTALYAAKTAGRNQVGCAADDEGVR